jgi:hypothetical protein
MPPLSGTIFLPYLPVPVRVRDASDILVRLTAVQKVHGTCMCRVAILTSRVV